MTNDEKYLLRCLQLAKNGLGTTYPNPLVGSVIVSDNDHILGEGWHYQSGMHHAEVNAIASAQSKGYDIKDFKSATIYVNLEPCSHYGKTPPCASLIVEMQFKRVVIGTLDPHDKVAGKGVALLKEAGIEVRYGVRETECNELNKRFFNFHKNNKPYITLKWAQTQDGFIAPLQQEPEIPYWISNKKSKQRAHTLRAQEQAILIGMNTLLKDQPALTTREWYGTDLKKYIWATRAGQINTDIPENATIITTNDIQVLLEKLMEDQIQSIIIEGGTKTLQQFINADLWDQAIVFTAQGFLSKGVAAPNFIKEPLVVKSESLDTNLMTLYTPAL
jgi:diaminohydroxyphosphoribosylaminopyrimidine deaminase/5-amino-6-(5-phosphoribosylamino)uracil reductase